MSTEVLQIGWVSAALFYGIGQAILGILISCSPMDRDKATAYFEWIISPLDNILTLSTFSLLFAVALTWAYSASQNSVIWYTAAIFITIFTYASYKIWRNVLYIAIQSRVR